MVSENGVSTDPSKVSKILDRPIPRNVSELRSFLGLSSYYRRFIKDFAKMAVPLHRLTEKNKPFVWSESCLEAFNELKRELTNHAILAYPDFNKELTQTQAIMGLAASFHKSKGTRKESLDMPQSVSYEARASILYNQERAPCHCCIYSTLPSLSLVNRLLYGQITML